MKSYFDPSLKRRIDVVLLFFLIAFLAVAARLFTLQVIYYREYSALASKQHRLSLDRLSERGKIYAKDKNGYLIPLALNEKQEILAVSPKDVKDPDALIDALTKNFAMDKDFLEDKLSKKNDPHEILVKNVAPETAEKIKALGIYGLFFEEEVDRVYPQKTTAAHLLGFANKEQEELGGKYGLEKLYDEELRGEGWFIGKNTAGFLVALGRRIVNPAKTGANLFLTIDFNIQRKAEEVLNSTRNKWQAVSGDILITEPKTGKILALAGSPNYDPNLFSKEKDFSVFLNPVTESMYELGSVLKPVTMAAGLEEGVVRPDSTYEDTGEIKIGGYRVNNFDGKSHGTQTMTQVLEKSLNTGAVYVARLVGKENHRAYLKSFGFGQKTDIDLPGEVAGDVSNLTEMRDIDFATASFGQGIAVTPLQLAMAIGTVANNGVLMRPYVVERIVDGSGNEIKKEPQAVRPVISKESAEALTKMLVSTVRSGFENKAGVKGYFVAGKTGTAQIPRKDGRGYDPDKVIHTFVGYAPAFNPRFLVLLQLNEPQGNRFAANTLTPAFHDLAEYILNYYEIPPDEK